NCPIAVTRSAVLFVVRTLLPDDVPMNGGVSRAVDVTAPAGCLVAARPPSAVAAGNVETSRRIADTVFRALASAGCQVPAQGQGRSVGGEGVVREFEALAPMEATLLTERRRHGPAGAAGGRDGAPGANLLNGAALPSKTTLRLATGDVLRIETPGGGGWGKGD